MTNSKHILVLFDGVCNLCSGSVQFIIRRDPAGVFRFASLQSDYAQNMLQTMGLPTDDLYSIVVIDNGKAYQQSDALFRVVRNLRGLWPVLLAGKIVPKFIRDAAYRLIARNRYRLFGKKDQCMIPTPELKARFVG